MYRQQTGSANVHLHCFALPQRNAATESASASCRVFFRVKRLSDSERSMRAGLQYAVMVHLLSIG